MIYLDKHLNLYYENGVWIGEIIPDFDGYYYFWPIARGGSWSAEVLKQIAGLLDVINEPWDKQVQADQSISGVNSENLAKDSHP